jgi:hypothetical protein
MLVIICKREMHDAEYYNHEPIETIIKKRCSIKLLRETSVGDAKSPTIFYIFYFFSQDLHSRRPREPNEIYIFKKKIFIVPMKSRVAKKKSEQKKTNVFKLDGFCWTRNKKNNDDERNEEKKICIACVG